MNKPVCADNYESLLDLISITWKDAKRKAVVDVNTTLIYANWQTGRYIVDFEQNGVYKAKYGDNILEKLSKDLTVKNGKGFSRSNLNYMRKFYISFPDNSVISPLLSWSHYFELLKCNSDLELQFYFHQCIAEKWSVRELERQIKSSLFERLALSTDKEGVLEMSKKGHPVMKPEDLIHDPYVLEFAGFPARKRYKEKDFENAIKANMETFLLELGRGFAFIGRQYTIPIGSKRFKVDLVYYHCILNVMFLLI